MNLPKNVTPKDLKIQYHKLAKIYHPDMNKLKEEDDKESEKMQARFRQLQESYETLKVRIWFYVDLYSLLRVFSHSCNYSLLYAHVS